MCSEKVIYISPLNNYKVITCSGLWGYPKYEIECWNGCFWESRFDGGGSLASCFTFLCNQNIISKDEKKFQVKKWCK